MQHAPLFCFLCVFRFIILLDCALAPPALPVFSILTWVTHLSCVACLPRFSTEWSCNRTEMRPAKFQRSNDNENDHRCLCIS